MNPLLRKTSRKFPTFSPAIDIRDVGDSLLLKADLPGVDSDDIEIVIEDRVLTLIARSSVDSDPRYVLIHEEFRPSHFFRSFILTDEVDCDRIRASFENGLLTVVLPKRLELSAGAPAERSAG